MVWCSLKSMGRRELLALGILVMVCCLVSMGGDCGHGGEPPVYDGSDARDCGQPLACEVDWMNYPEDGPAYPYSDLRARDNALPDERYTAMALDSVLWIDDQSDTHRVCVTPDLDEERMPYKVLKADNDSLQAYADSHRTDDFLRQPLHFIVAMAYEDTTIPGYSSYIPGNCSFIFDVNVLKFAIHVNERYDWMAVDLYKEMRDYVALHEIGHQLGVNYEHWDSEYEGSCVMYGYLLQEIPGQIYFCSQCSTKIAQTVAELVPATLLASAGTWSPAVTHRMALDGTLYHESTQHRVDGAPVCKLDKGKSSNGLKAFCRIDGDTLVLGQPVIIEFGLVNVGDDVAPVYGGEYKPPGASPPAIFIAEPGGDEYAYLATHSELISLYPSTAIHLSPGDSLTATIQLTYYGNSELLFPFTGRWGIYCAYYMPKREGFRSAEVASEIAWVDVIDRDGSDELAWGVFRKAKKSLVNYRPSGEDSVMGAYRQVVESFSTSSYYPHALFMYAGCLKFRGEYGAAMKYYQRYRSEFGTTLLASEAEFEIAECLHQLGRYDEALAAFERAQIRNRWSWRAAPRFRSEYEDRRPWRSSRLY